MGSGYRAGQKETRDSPRHRRADPFGKISGQENSQENRLSLSVLHQRKRKITQGLARHHGAIARFSKGLKRCFEKHLLVTLRHRGESLG